MSPVMSYDPLPPADSVAGYTRPERFDQQFSKHRLLSYEILDNSIIVKLAKLFFQ